MLNFEEYIEANKKSLYGFQITGKALREHLEETYAAGLDSVIDEPEDMMTLGELDKQGRFPDNVFAAFSYRDDPMGMYLEGYLDAEHPDLTMEIRIHPDIKYTVDRDGLPWITKL